MNYDIDKNIFVEHGVYDYIWHSIKNYEPPYYNEMIRSFPEENNRIEHALWINIIIDGDEYVGVEGIQILVENV